MKLSAKISNLRNVLANKIGLSTEDQQEFEAIYVRALGIEKGILPYKIKIDSTELDLSLKKFSEKLEETCANNSALNQILRNASTESDLRIFYFELINNGYDKKYKTWDNWLDNFGWYSPKSESYISEVRQVINGMINEIKRLEKENEALKRIGK